jgi:hypothetical protein
MPLISSSAQYPIFSAYGTGPDIGLGGHHQTFAMTIGHLEDLDIGLTANHIYYLGVGIDISGSEGDWRWVESTQSLPSDTAIGGTVVTLLLGASALCALRRPRPSHPR